MRKKASELIFISRIIRDGSGTIALDDKQQKELQESKFFDYKINILSLSNETYIASGFNSYIVKLKLIH